MSYKALLDKLAIGNTSVPHIKLPVLTALGQSITTMVIPTSGSSYKPLTVSDWIPHDAPVPGDDFFGVDRSIDPPRLSGHRFYKGDNIDIAEFLFTSAHYISREGGNPDLMILPKAEYIALFGPRASPVSRFTTGYGSMEVHPTGDHDDYGFMLQSDSWNRLQGLTGDIQLLCIQPSANGRLNFCGAPAKTKKCECGAHITSQPRHSSWCPVR
jgi:hypothetical protein